MKILVTGASGYVGKHLCDYFKRSDRHEVVAVSRSSGIDLLIAGSLDSFDDVDCIVHLAAHSGVPQSWEQPERYNKENCCMTLTVLEKARKSGIPVLFLSSYMYGTPQYLPIDELHPVQCNNPYAYSKKLCEDLFKQFNELYGVSACILRLFNVYGREPESSDALVPFIAQQVVASKNVEVRDASPKRDLLFIDDLLHAIERVVSEKIIGYSEYNVGFGASVSIPEIVETFQEITGEKINLINNNVGRNNEIPETVCESAKFKGRFDWWPVVTLKQGLATYLTGVK